MALDLVRHLVAGGPYELTDVATAKECYALFRGQRGAKAVATPLLTMPADNAKYAKSIKLNEERAEDAYILTFGLSLAQADSSHQWNTCRFSSPECRMGCVSFAGKGELATVQAGRIRKTQFLAEHPSEFFTLLFAELQKVWETHGTHALVRLNTFSDIPWETLSPSVFARFPRMRFYDYTKWGVRSMDANLGAFEWPGNYRLIYSASEKTKDSDVVRSVMDGVNYAVLFDVPRGQPLPAIWEGVQVIDGDSSDDRWYDAKYSVIGLRAKGRMRKGNWKMVRKVHNKKENT